LDGGRVKRHRPAATGRSCAIGKAGNPDITMPFDVVIGPAPSDRCERYIHSPATLEHPHFHCICRSQIETAWLRSPHPAGRRATGRTGKQRPHLHPRAPSTWAACCRQPKVLPSVEPASSARQRQHPEASRADSSRRTAPQTHEDWAPPAAIGLLFRQWSDKFDISGSASTSDTSTKRALLEDTIRANRRSHHPHLSHRGAGAAATPPTSSGLRARQRVPSSTNPRAPTPKHASRTPRHCDGVPPPGSFNPERRGLSLNHAFRVKRSPLKTSSTTSAPSASFAAIPRPWPGWVSDHRTFQTATDEGAAAAILPKCANPRRPQRQSPPQALYRQGHRSIRGLFTEFDL